LPVFPVSLDPSCLQPFLSPRFPFVPPLHGSAMEFIIPNLWAPGPSLFGLRLSFSLRPASGSSLWVPNSFSHVDRVSFFGLFKLVPVYSLSCCFRMLSEFSRRMTVWSQSPFLKLPSLVTGALFRRVRISPCPLSIFLAFVSMSLMSRFNFCQVFILPQGASFLSP